MEVITKFKANDGKEFDNELECIKYEDLIQRVDCIMKSFPEKPKLDGCGFENGDGYIQHSKESIKKVKNEILELCKEFIDHHWIQQTIDRDDADPSWVHRLLGDYEIAPLTKAWYRFMCIDFESREWGQPYFANNPDKAKQIRLN